MGISFITTLFIARNLGPTNYGQLSYALSVTTIFGFVAPLGLDSILYRELIKYPEKRNALLGTTFGLKMIAGFTIAAATIFSAPFFATDTISRILISILAGTFILNAFQIISYEFLSRTQSKYQSIITIIVTAILGILKILVILSGKGVIYLALIVLCESFLYAVFYVFLYQRKIEESIRSWSWDGRLAKELLKDAFPVLILSGFTLIYARVDQVLIKHMLDAASVGMYDAAVRLVDVWNFIPGVIVTVLFPVIVNNKNSPLLFKARMFKLSMLLFFSSAGIALVVTILAPWMIHLLYGASFAPSVIVLQIYIWSAIGTALGMLVYNYLIAENRRVALILSSFIPMVINIGLNLVLIPIYGIAGAAIATLVSYSLVPLAVFFPTKKNKAKDADDIPSGIVAV